ncbi:hypothetical protein B7R25_05130 [Subtercola boreus]|uniref:Glycerol operon regulatory protein n=2 Tax=Subtercola boreus TaxID=120213 RepID=A0A3E0WDY5_9MICO|nr:IclR family transcriptional regulator [Subtercola boreus]RFA22059.1 hypothetical protein B7R24_05060 [Subtercola boreus]RFA22239.1 hypothetical protein B7R23_05005 [Subtercola boreus]RFA28102.1 hypothetical protein B7R25_05130 [Subtercola boreus]
MTQPAAAKPSASKNTETEVKSAARTIELLEMLAGETRPLTLSEIASRLSFPVSSVHQLLRTLVSRGWLATTTDGVGGGYTIGVRALMTGMSFLERDPVVQAMKPILTMLREELGETIHLARLDGSRMVYLVSRESEHQLRAVSRVGQALPAHATGLGKAALAALPDEEVQQRLGETLVQITPHTIDSMPELLADLALTRRRGYAAEQEENTVGNACIAVAIPDVPGHYAVSCSVPLMRMTPERASTIAQTLQVGVRMASNSLAGQGMR